MCEVKALKWTEEAREVYKMIVARNEIRRIPSYLKNVSIDPQIEIIPSRDYTIRDKPAEPIHANYRR